MGSSQRCYRDPSPSAISGSGFHNNADCFPSELSVGCGLVQAYASDCDFSAVVVFTTNWTARHPSQHVDLTGMCQSVGYCALEHLFRRRVQRLIPLQVVVKCLERLEEALNFLVPGQGRRVVPGLISPSDGKSPIEQVAHVSEYSRRRASLLAGIKVGEALRRAAQSFPTAVPQSANQLPHHLPSYV